MGFVDFEYAFVLVEPLFGIAVANNDVDISKLSCPLLVEDNFALVKPLFQSVVDIFDKEYCTTL